MQISVRPEGKARVGRSGRWKMTAQERMTWKVRPIWCGRYFIGFCIFTCISHPLQAYYVPATVCVTRATWSGGMSESGRLTMAQSHWGAQRQA